MKIYPQHSFSSKTGTETMQILKHPQWGINKEKQTPIILISNRN